MTKLFFIKKENKQGIFKHPRRTNYFFIKKEDMSSKKRTYGHPKLSAFANYCVHWMEAKLSTIEVRGRGLAIAIVFVET